MLAQQKIKGQLVFACTLSGSYKRYKRKVGSDGRKKTYMVTPFSISQTLSRVVFIFG